MPYYVTPKGKRDNDLRLMGYIEKYKRLHREVQESPTNVIMPQATGAHAADMVREDMDILRDLDNHDSKITALRRIIAKSVVVHEPIDATLARIGTIISVQRYSKHLLRIGDVETYRIVGYEETDLKTSPPSLSYTSPLIRDMLGHAVEPDGEFYEVQLSGETIFMELLEIRLPMRGTLARLSSAA